MIFIYLTLFWILYKFYSNCSIKTSKIDIELLPDLDKIIGLESVKDEISCYMELINNDCTYLDWDVKLPRGILLIGPPGTGKTLLVKALAKELDIPIEVASGSDFVEMYVGVGALRIRKLFSRARQHKNCIIFIDEIDSVGSVRDMGNNSERANTLNQLLVEMDGFNSDTQILVFAATNMAKNLDAALLRSGRFDKKVYFDLPNVKEREKMFELYFSDTEIPITYMDLAKRTTGMSGADIANITNQAKLNAMYLDDKFLTTSHINEAIDEVMIGREKRERTLSISELERVAHHEAGHALIACLLKGATKPLKVSIIPRGEFALGFSQSQPEDKQIYTRDDILCKVAILYGGRIAEEIIYGDFSSGASDDIEKATSLLNSFVTRWGMETSYGPVNPRFTDLEDEEYDFNIIRELALYVENNVRRILTDNKKYIIKIAKSLLEKETIFFEDVKSIIKKKRLDTVSLVPYK